MNRFQRSWQLFKSSLIVMQRDKRLLLFPILTTALTCLIVVLFLMPIAFQPTGHSYLSDSHWQAVGQSLFAADIAAEHNAAVAAEGKSPHHQTQVTVGGVKPLALGYFAVMYFVSMFCATFFNVAFYSQILAALSGGAVSIQGGLLFACRKWKIILMWTLFAGAVGYVIKTLEERFGLIGQWIMKLIGAAWSIACVFVIPVIVTEESTSNPLTVLKKSASTLVRTWGESLIGYVGVSFGGLLVLVLSLFWLGTGIAVAMALHLYWVTAAMVLSWLVGIVIWSYLLSVASQIFRCALFLYASQGALPQPYTSEMMAAAWKMKK